MEGPLKDNLSYLAREDRWKKSVCTPQWASLHNWSKVDVETWNSGSLHECPLKNHKSTQWTVFKLWNWRGIRQGLRPLCSRWASFKAWGVGRGATLCGLMPHSSSLLPSTPPKAFIHSIWEGWNRGPREYPGLEPLHLSLIHLIKYLFCYKPDGDSGAALFHFLERGWGGSFDPWTPQMC